MRKLMIPGLFIALFGLLAGTGVAEACGSKDAGIKSASASSCGSEKQAEAAAAQAKNADSKSDACHSSAANASKASAACASQAKAACASQAKAACASQASAACKAACGTARSADVVSNDLFINSYIDLKMQDVMRFEMTPHPVEFDMYYSY